MSRFEPPSDALRGRVRGLQRLGLTVCLALSACTSAPPSGALPNGSAGPPPTSPATSARPIATPTPAATPAPTASSVTAETRPPAVTLRDSAGRAVEAQVGTFQWAGVVSDSPLLAGAPATVGAGQDLAIGGPGPLPSSWRATLYRDPADPASGRPFGEGVAPVGLRGPTQPGTWTLALHLVYPAGDVIHFWRLTVAG